jgi:hypothetical protein
LVSPDILGVSSGAALGAVLGIYFSLGVVGIQALAFALGLGAVAAVYLIGTFLRHHDPILTLVLAGVVIGTLLSSVVGLIKYLADPYNQLPAITFWLLGSLTGVTRGGPVGDSSGHRLRSRAALSAALAHERYDDGRRAYIGQPQQVITPETLRAVYGVEVEIVPLESQSGEKFLVCIPSFTQRGIVVMP